MTTATVLPEFPEITDFLPARKADPFAAGELIYEDISPELMYVVHSGRVKVTRRHAGRPIVIDIYGAGDVFGSLFPGFEFPVETATAIDDGAVACYSRAEIEAVASIHRSVFIAVRRLLASRLVRTGERFQSMAADIIRQRVIRALLEFNTRFGTDGKMPAITHQLMSEYVGTSREIVTATYNQLRRDEALQYSRHFISVDVARLEAELAK